MCCANNFRAKDKHNYKARVGKVDKTKYYCVRESEGRNASRKTDKKERKIKYEYEDSNYSFGRIS